MGGVALLEGQIQQLRRPLLQAGLLGGHVVDAVDLLSGADAEALLEVLDEGADLLEQARQGAQLLEQGTVLEVVFDDGRLQQMQGAGVDLIGEEHPQEGAQLEPERGLRRAAGMASS